jgi:gliding motility-associated lipoprotein GldJ
MAGNVAEWVADVYRPIIDEEMNDINYYRGNQYFKTSIDSLGKTINKTYETRPGSLKNEIENEESIDRINYIKGDNRDFNDGDRYSVRDFNLEGKSSNMYNSPSKDNPLEESTTLVNNEARVYKGGSWLDRAYYLDPAQRRYYPETMTSNFIGFRCAMSYLGESRNSKKPRKRR